MKPHETMNKALLHRIRLTILFYMAVLLASGITAFPLVWELSILVDWFGKGTVVGNIVPGLGDWLALVKEGLASNSRQFPFIAYGTDWLAFAHIMIATAFIGPLRDPVRNIWIIHWGMICCIGIIPLALICGTNRGIPWGWQCIDCSFGVFGIVPLILIDRWTKQLKNLLVIRKLYEVPVTSTEFTKEAYLSTGSGFYDICYEYREADKSVKAGIRFDNVSALKKTVERCSRLWQIEDAYDTLVEVVDSAWAKEIKAAVPDHLVHHYEFHHYMIYLDSVGCFEFIASSWNTFTE